MCQANYEKRERINDGRNGTKISRKIRMLGEKKTYKYLEIVATDTIKQVEMKEKNQRRTIKLLETKLYSKNLKKEINSWTIILVRYGHSRSRPEKDLDKWTREQENY